MRNRTRYLALNYSIVSTIPIHPTCTAQTPNLTCSAQPYRRSSPCQCYFAYQTKPNQTTLTSTASHTALHAHNDSFPLPLPASLRSHPTPYLSPPTRVRPTACIGLPFLDFRPLYLLFHILAQSGAAYLGFVRFDHHLDSRPLVKRNAIMDVKSVLENTFSPGKNHSCSHLLIWTPSNLFFRCVHSRQCRRATESSPRGRLCTSPTSLSIIPPCKPQKN